MAPIHQIGVRMEAGGEPLARRVFAILKDRVEHRTAGRVVEGATAPAIALAVERGVGAEAFRIEEAPGGGVRVVGGDVRGLLYGVGKLLRTSQYDSDIGNSGFQTSAWRGRSAPHCTLRGMYFACHFHNWYHVAPAEELRRYIEDLALWGVNTIGTIFPFVNLSGWDDPQTAGSLAQTRAILQAAKGLGLSPCLLACPNNLFRDAPDQFRAAPLPDPLRKHGNLGANLCPSIPAAREYILDTYRELFSRLADIGLDALCLWPYDEGGCACQRCRPWGAGGFLRISRDVADLARRVFPAAKVILSTWTFDTPPEGEWEGLAKSLAAAGGGWVDYIMADAHEDFPRWPLERGVPGGVPMVNFPEISMWGNSPWGGYGAHVLPRRFQRLWDQVGRALDGGLPYSEGIYEDMNKAIVSQFYWDRGRPALDTLREYIAYEFSPAPAVLDDCLRIIDCLETSATSQYLKQAVDPAPALAACELAGRVESRLPDWARKGWRWEILRLRTTLDRERFAGAGLETPVAAKALRRLIEIYHAQVEMTDPLHRPVRPPLKAGGTV